MRTNPRLSARVQFFKAAVESGKIPTFGEEEETEDWDDEGRYLSAC